MTDNAQRRFIVEILRVARINKKYIGIAIAAVLVVGITTWVTLSSFPQTSSNSSADDLPEPLRIIPVTSLESLNNALIAALPGDRIVVKDGAYTTSSNIVVAARGTASNPIVIAAQSKAGAEITGTHGMRLEGARYVVISGFNFTHSQDNGKTTDDMAIICNDCYNVRFTGNIFGLVTAYAGQGDSQSIDRYNSHWLGITGSGSNNRVDHNTFQNKSTRGAFLFVYGDDDNLVQNTVIDNNRFSGQSYSQGNGGECVIIGNSAFGPTVGNALIEYNIFEGCNGDREAVTIKASNNIVRYNTFRGNQGSLTFRHGSFNIADGNIFIDGNSGIRAYGYGHKIINNYFANNTGQISSLLGPIVIGTGTVLTDLSGPNAEYSQARNILIAHNTLVNNRAGILIGHGDGSYLPESITIANNIITGSSGRLIQVLSGEAGFANNILYPTGSATLGDIPSNGFTNVDPQMVSSGKIMSPSVSSPAVDAISASEAYGVTADIDGQTRNGLFDIGADELR